VVAGGLQSRVPELQRREAERTDLNSVTGLGKLVYNAPTYRSMRTLSTAIGLMLGHDGSRPPRVIAAVTEPSGYR